jgi:WD40 repeat protein
MKPQRLATGIVLVSLLASNVASGKDAKPVQVLKHSAGPALFSPDRKVMVAFAGDGSRMGLQLWEVGTWKPLAKIEDVPWPRTFVVFDREGKHLAFCVMNHLEALQKGGADSSLKVWEIARRKEVRSIPLGKVLFSVPLAFSADGKRVAVWTMRREDMKEGMPAPPVKVWDVKTGKEVKDLKEKPSLDKEIEFRLDVRTSKNFFQDKQGGSVTAKRPAPLVSPHLSLRTSELEIRVPNEAGYLSFYPGKVITVRDRKAKKTVELKGHGNNVQTLAVSADEKYLASADGDIRIWDLATKKEVGRISRPGADTHDYMIFSPDNKWLLVSEGPDIRPLFLSKSEGGPFNPKITGDETIELFDVSAFVKRPK